MAYPTESCFGLGCDPRQHAAIRRILGAKRRGWWHGLILIGARLSHLLRYVNVDDVLLAPAVESWPGPHTWLLPARPAVSRWLRGRHSSVAVRITGHPDAARLCQAVGGAIVSTSANRRGAAPTKTQLETQQRFGQLVDYVLPGRIGGLANPTEIRDAATRAVIRTG